MKNQLKELKMGRKKGLIKTAGIYAVMSAAALPLFNAGAQEQVKSDPKVQKIRFIEDDAQNYMVSKVYELKNLKAVDAVPFILGSVKRYSANSHVDRINYSAAGKQWVVVTTPIEMMPYVDDMIAKMDRNVAAKDVNGSIVDGTGITRYVYKPQWRSSQEMVNIMTKTGISSDAATDAANKINYDARVIYDAPSNLIYWKDTPNKSADLLKYLTWLDRPVPQVNVSFKIYEIRDSDLIDLGIDYMAWKNGPGLEIFGAGADMMNLSMNEKLLQTISGATPAIAENLSYAFGGFFFAPAFDMSFIRMLQQNGKANVAATANLSVANYTTPTAGGTTTPTYTVSFTPEYQNIVKANNDKTTVVASLADSTTSLTLTNPVICFGAVGSDKDGRLPYSESDYSGKFSGVFDFKYALSSSTAVERNNVGTELAEGTSLNSYGTVVLKQENLLAAWTKDSEVEQTIGIPYLCEFPVLKYIFGTTTTNKEKTHYFVTVQAELVHPDTKIAEISGKLTSLQELVSSEEKNKQRKD